MPRLAFRTLAPALICAACTATCLAQAPTPIPTPVPTPVPAANPKPAVTADLNPWGRFEPGAWKLVRVITETLDEKGQVVSTSKTDTKTTLMKIDDNGVSLEVQACMEVAGKSFQAEPQVIKQGFNGELAAPDSNAKGPTDGQVVIEDRAIPCKVQQIELVSPNDKTTVRLYYSTTVAPYILKRLSVTTDPDGKNVLGSTSFEVLALQMPVRLRGETRSGSYVKTMHKNSNGSVTTLAVVLPDVPGGVFSHSSKELDKDGRVVRRSTLELVDYGVKPEDDRAASFKAKRAARRAAKSSPRRGE